MGKKKTAEQEPPLLVLHLGQTIRRAALGKAGPEELIAILKEAGVKVDGAASSIDATDDRIRFSRLSFSRGTDSHSSRGGGDHALAYMLSWLVGRLAQEAAEPLIQKALKVMGVGFPRALGIAIRAPGDGPKNGKE